jgi:micrococcal nuclease
MRFNPRLLGIVLILLGLAGLVFPRLPSPEALLAGRSTGSHESVRESANPVARPVKVESPVTVDSSIPTPGFPADRDERKNDRQACKVLIVYDGDTLGCDLNGNGRIERPEEEIRLLGIDSPEMHYSRKNPTHDSAHPVDEPFAPEASRWMETRTLRKVVYLEFDLRRFDRYGRTLAYVYAEPADEPSLNAQLLSTGYAKTLFLGKNRKHEAEFMRVESEARRTSRGLWGMK